MEKIRLDGWKDLVKRERGWRENSKVRWMERLGNFSLNSSGSFLERQPNLVGLAMVLMDNHPSWETIGMMAIFFPLQQALDAGSLSWHMPTVERSNPEFVESSSCRLLTLEYPVF